MAVKQRLTKAEVIQLIIDTATRKGISVQWNELYKMVHLRYGFEEWLVNVIDTTDKQSTIALWHKDNFYVTYKQNSKVPGYHLQWQRVTSVSTLTWYIKQHAYNKGFAYSS